jgi:cellulose synthase/poly-beta-1,6-N-acetylglucosamine synthase-like glycosyltransferase
VFEACCGLVKRGRRIQRFLGGELPVVSIMVPVKNEAKCVARLLKELLALDYPVEKREIIIVNDTSDNVGHCLSFMFVEYHLLGSAKKL